MEEGRRHYVVTLALLTVFFQREFHTSASWVTWIAAGFLLSSSVLTPILGKLGDSHGKKRMPRIFGLASLALAMVLLATMHDAPWTIYAWMVFMGVGLAFCFATLGTLVAAFGPTFLLTRRPTGRPVPEPAR